MLSKFKIIDNSGAIIGKIIRIYRKKSSLYVGAFVLVTIMKTIPNSKIRKGQKVKAVIVNGNYTNLISRVRTQKSLLLVKKAPKGNDLLPIATRIKSPVSANLRNINGMSKIISLSKRTL